jgi:cell division control protein 7
MVSFLLPLIKMAGFFFQIPRELPGDFEMSSFSSRSSPSPSIPSSHDFEVIELIGSGSFANCFHAIHIRTGVHVALKCLFPTNPPNRIVKEVNWLRSLDHPNVARLRAVFRDSDQATIVLDFVPHLPFRQLLPQLTGNLLKDYMKGLLSGLAYVHSKKMIHRDVKPANFLFDPGQRTGCLIDFGLCEDDLFIEPLGPFPEALAEDSEDLKHPTQFQYRPKMRANRAGSRGFRAPEVLLLTENPSTKIDIWSAGVILLSVITQRYPFFTSGDDLTSLVEVSIVLGTDRLRDAARECRRSVRFPSESAGVDLLELCQKTNPYIDEMSLDLEVFDLLKKMLEPVPSKRIAAAEALSHPFLKEIK